jgi:DNA-binding CsgD family transcriptional regulator
MLFTERQIAESRRTRHDRRVATFPVSSALVGRAGDLTALENAFADEQVTTVLIGGEAGIGKSRLAGEFISRLGEDVLVLVGRCPEFGADGVPFAPFIAVMRSLERQRDTDEIATLLPPNPALARWMPRLAARTGPAAADSDQIRLSGEILTLLEQLALTQPVLLVLEDLHWADDSSRELFAFLVANLAQDQVLLIGTYRPAEPGPLRGLIAELRRNAGIRVVSPQPLTRHEVGRQLAALLGREPEPGLITRIADRSGGNPLFVEALSQSPEQIPARLTDLLLTFLAGLAPQTRTVLELAAVIGSPVRHELLAEAAELPQPALYEAMRELVGRQLLLATETGYEFRHVLIRQAIYDELLPIERTGLHARLAKVLRTRSALPPTGNHSAELAHHAAAAGELPQALAASWQAAVIAGAAGAHSQRLRQLERVLKLWDQVPEAPHLLGTTELAVLEHIIDACARSGTVERGIEATDAALAMTDTSTDTRRGARLHHRRASLLSQTGAGPGEDLQRALQLLPADPPTLERGEILAELAVTRVFSGDTSGATAAASAAVQVAELLGAAALAARGYAYLGLAAAHQPGTAAGYFTRARAAASAADDQQTLLNVVTWESSLLLAAGNYQAAITTIQQGLRTAHETFRFAESAPVLLVKWAQALTALGRWPQALSLIDEAGLQDVPPLSRAALLLCHAKIALARGNSAAAHSTAAEAGRLLGGGQWAQAYRLQLQAVRCQLALEQGDQAGAAQILAETAAANDSAALTAHPHEAWPLVVLAARIPNAPAALVALAGSLPTASPVDAAQHAVFLAHTTAAAGRWDDAASAWHALEQPYDEAQSLLAAAQAHAAEGNRAAANVALQAAAKIAAGLSATPLTDSAERLARRARLIIGPTPADAQPEPHDGNRSTRFGLTPRELDVLRLVSKGMSNRQLAAELFISANTAGVHVSRILTKLGVATRTEAAAFAHQHKLLAQVSG